MNPESRTARTSRTVRTVRAVRADEWEKARELRLAALRDPVAHLAYLDTYEAAVERPDSVWRENTARAAESGEGKIRQFVAEESDGRWVGAVTVLLELAGQELPFGASPETAQTHLVGVYVRPEARGSGVIDELFRTALEWSWAHPERVERVRLYVHGENGRAAAFYRRFGFVPSGARVPVPGHTTAMEVEYEMRRGGGGGAVSG
ncbi:MULTISPECIES: GNAT family N-acetyltransferase [unclassified Streptomyces]|uniref:GNAT family N-acetyltransferase n=1 Tax=unclassified Streptomyces TaxID=2593676 RepID=UPI0016609024|nr:MULTISPECIES: GNAT family N-acetyltransferase [unclassified Streptomyces]MBD0712488.1 GNAT family N-acetyltransferase [Streptomyces sp. CBMA291]MBD0716862.1 GNAT family N-acetyltransferase [Streptomyces sp. CBMA370]